jgi:uncharacterized glyoxalase superfamily protein PhnB
MYGGSRRLRRNSAGGNNERTVLLPANNAVSRRYDKWPPFPAPMYLVTDRVDQLYGLAVANGATGNQEPGERGYGRSAGFLDKWGNQWWLNWPTQG